jgi:acyl-CoA synthetase (AMP-forming)/AMP-acid ligase II
MNIVGDFLETSARRDPHRVALIDGDARFTFAELLAMSDRVSRGLLGLGLRPGDRASYHANNRWEVVVTLLAAVRAGMIVAPINVMATEAEVREQLDDLGSRVVLTTADAAPTIRAVRAATGRPEHVALYEDPDGVFRRWLREDGGPMAPVDRGPTDAVTLFYTSGTTGRSKGVPHAHDFVDAVAHSTAMACRFTPRDVFLVTSPMFWTVAPIHCVLPVIHAGGTLVLMSRFDADRCVELVREHGVTSFFGVPTMYALLVDRSRAALERLRTLRVCLSAGAPRPPELVAEFEALTGATLLDVYGATEAQLLAREILGVPRVAGSCGTLGGTVETRVVDGEGRDVPPGQPGEIVARGLTCVRGYWNRPEETAAAFRDGWFHTGDVGVLDGGYLFVKDRLKDMIITGGANIYPAEVENVLASHPKVQLCAVVGIPDRIKGEVAVACVVPRAGQTPDAAELDAFCRERLAAYKVPRRFDFCTELPQTPAGKLRKREIRRRTLAEAGPPP